VSFLSPPPFPVASSPPLTYHAPCHLASTIRHLEEAFKVSTASAHASHASPQDMRECNTSTLQRSLAKTRESRMSIPEFDITGQKVLIVGGGRGIGKGIALAFAEAGADVAVSALTPTGVNRVAEEVRALGCNALALLATPPRRPTWTAAKMERFGHLDTRSPMGDLSVSRVVQLPDRHARHDRRRMAPHRDINPTEASGCRAGPHLLARRQGSVVNISGWPLPGSASRQHTTRPKPGPRGSPNSAQVASRARVNAGPGSLLDWSRCQQMPTSNGMLPPPRLSP
jgi:hypothetical protein